MEQKYFAHGSTNYTCNVISMTSNDLRVLTCSDCSYQLITTIFSAILLCNLFSSSSWGFKVLVFEVSSDTAQLHNLLQLGHSAVCCLHPGVVPQMAKPMKPSQNQLGHPADISRHLQDSRTPPLSLVLLFLSLHPTSIPNSAKFQNQYSEEHAEM